MAVNEERLMQEFRKTFLTETAFMLDDCEESFIGLEESTDKTAELNRIFRLIHSIKGSAASVGFTELSRFAHVAEELLYILRADPQCVSQEIVSLLLRVNDTMKDWVNELSKSQLGTVDCSQLTQELINFTRKLSLAEESCSLENANAGDIVWTHSLPPIELKETQPAAQSEETLKGMPKSGTVVHEAHSGFQVPGSQAVKIDADRIDSVLNLVGELVVTKSQLMHHEALARVEDQRLTNLMLLLDRTVRELQERALAMRLTSLRSLFLKLNRMVRDLSLALGKPIEFVMEGEDTEIDRSLIEAISDPLLHLCRNAVDHGIESLPERQKHGKNSKGHIQLRAGNQGGRIFIEVRDDGAGIDRTRVLEKAMARGLLPAHSDTALVPEQDVFQFLFHPGFSTKDTITQVSGRGVGLDVVKSNVEGIKGAIEVESTLGLGTCFRMWIPLTTSIADGMQILSGETVCVLPMESVRELVQLETTSITRLGDGAEMVNVREKVLPLLRLNECLQLPATKHHHKETSQISPLNNAPKSASAAGVIVVLECKGKSFALIADAVLGQSQVVIKGLGPVFQNVPGVAGAAVLGDGKIGLVLDVANFTGLLNKQTRKKKKSAAQKEFAEKTLSKLRCA